MGVREEVCFMGVPSFLVVTPARMTLVILAGVSFCLEWSSQGEAPCGALLRGILFQYGSASSRAPRLVRSRSAPWFPGRCLGSLRPPWAQTGNESDVCSAA